MLLLKKNTFELSAGSPVVSAEEAGEVATAESIVAAAEAEAAKIEADAKVAFETQKKLGFAQGMMESRMADLERKLKLAGEATDYICSIESALGALVVKALRQCVGELKSEDLVMPMVHKAMDAIIRTQRQVTIRVAPAMVHVVRAKLETLLKDYPTVMRADVVEEPRLTGDACVVETAAGQVESSVEGQIAAIEKSINRQFSKDGH